MTKLTVSCHNFANEPKNLSHIPLSHAFRWRIGSSLAPLQTWPVLFPFYLSLCAAAVCRLATLGESERRGRCPGVSFWVLIFVSETRLPGFVSSTTGFSRWPGQKQEAPPPVIFSEKSTHTSGICFEVKFRFGLCTSKLKFRLGFVTIPDVCLAFA